MRCIGRVSALALTVAGLGNAAVARADVADLDQPIAAPLVPDLTALTDPGLAQLAQAYDASIAENVLSSVGRLALGRRAPRTPRLVAAVNPFRVHAPAGVAGPAVATLADQQLGAVDGIAVAVKPRFASASRFTTDIDLRHAAGPVDLDIDVTGGQMLIGATARAADAHGTALVAMAPGLQVGVAGQGRLAGANPAAADPRLGPVMRWQLVGGRAVLSSAAGYDLDAVSGRPASDRMHLKLDLDLKL